MLVRLSDDDNGYRTVLDISYRGLRMRTGLNVEEGQWVPVRVFFPGLAEEVEITGKVAWNDASGEFGLDYSELDSDDAGLLAVMLSHQAHLSEAA